MSQWHSDPTAWSAASLSTDAGQIELDDSCLAEIGELAALIDANPLPTLALNPADFAMPHCRQMLAQAGHILEQGAGFVLLDRLPVGDMTETAARGVYWLLMNCLSRAVAQSWDGKMLYDVADSTGKKPGNGIRPDVTNAEQNFHTDNSYNMCPPDHVALLCLQPAMAGGISRIVSLTHAHNMLKDRQPDLLARLYRPFYFDRQREHAPDDVQFIQRPVLQQENGRLRGRISAQLIRQGYALAGQDLDAEGTAALDAIYTLLNDPDHYREFLFAPGQIQIIDNRLLAHKRTGFADWPDPARKRRLVRLWLRAEGRRFYNG